MSLRFSRRALRDLDSIVGFIAADSPPAAARVRDAIIHTCKLVASRPFIGISNARGSEFRSKLVPKYQYRVHYAVRGGDVWIVHVRHTARQPWPIEDGR